jgi:predicted transposase YdaD
MAIARKPFDNTLRLLQTLEPSSWGRLFGAKTDKVEVCNTDLSTVSSNADCVLLLDAGAQGAYHVENQASYDAAMGNRLLLYNVLTNKSLGVPVRSIVLLLRPEADGPSMKGVYRQNFTDGVNYLEFKFEVIRVWERKPEEFLACGVGVLPLAFISDIKTNALPQLVKKTKKVLGSESRSKAAELWTAIDLLMGLRHSKDFVGKTLQGVKAMKESTTYQAILEEGEAKGKLEGKLEGERTILLHLASKKFGPPSKRTTRAIEAITSHERLSTLAERVSFVSSWSELLA